MIESISTQLKKATTPQHKQLDRLPTIAVLLSPTLTEQQYQTAILNFYHCFSSWQAQFEQLSLLYKVPKFAQINCFVEPLAQETASFEYQLKPACEAPIPEIAQLEHYLGYSYVLTGSQQGARFIVKRLQQSTIAEYFSFEYYRQQSSDENHALAWDTWKATLDSFAEQHQLDAAQIINSATQCFLQLTDWFSQPHTLVKKNQELILDCG